MIVWERGRLARNERVSAKKAEVEDDGAKRRRIGPGFAEFSKTLFALTRSLRARRPRSQTILSVAGGTPALSVKSLSDLRENRLL
ncbi:MAG: hypothetical protein ACRD9S_03520 [Pyrinomonadaceae bacterium]